MEQKHILMSALGVGVGVGIGLASGQTVSKWTGGGGFNQNVITVDRIEQELLRNVVDGRDSKVTFDEFPYYLRCIFKTKRGGQGGYGWEARICVSSILKAFTACNPHHCTEEVKVEMVGKSEQTRVLLTNAAYVHLKQAEFSKYTRNLSPASRAILLSGPTESYQQMLAKALAHYFEAKLLLLDMTNFSIKIQGKYGISNKESSFKRSISETTLERMSSLLGSFSTLPPREEVKGHLRRQSSGFETNSRGLEGSNNPPKLRRNASSAADMSSLCSTCTPVNPAPLRRTSSWAFDEKFLIQALYRVLVSVSKSSPLVVYLRDVQELIFRSQRIYTLFQKMLKKLAGPVLILGSRMSDVDNCNEVDERLSLLFPYNIEISPPEEETHLVSWKTQLEEDMKIIQFQDNRNHIIEVLAENDLYCDDLGSICLSDTFLLSNYIQEIVVSAISHHLMNNKDPEYRNGNLIISSKSLSHGLSFFQRSRKDGKDTINAEANAQPDKEAEVKGSTLGKPGGLPPVSKSVAQKPVADTEAKRDIQSPGPSVRLPEVPPDNEFEKRIRPEVIPASDIGVSFADIGALEETKESLQELVMLPLRRPDLFKGGILKPCRGILLFGPPGTGKTMLAKAIANEAGASFINVSMSTITSKWFGEDEKNVRALFTLAAKVSPTIIFVDEVDSMLGQRTRVGEHEAMRKIKNEFMTHWDGLLSKPGEGILVLAATNRPFDLDEAIIRRFERRIMVGLPSVENRELILKTLLSKEKTEDGLDFKELAAMTEGYSGSDLKNLCTTAAYRPVRELIQQERLKDLERKGRVERPNKERPDTKEGKEERVITLRPLNMQDMKQAKNQASHLQSDIHPLPCFLKLHAFHVQKITCISCSILSRVAPSFAAEGTIMNELRQWNESYGEGGSRKKEQLSYFL
ncbi:hypothetical protein GIB67_008260 [Kingdonia uniflora]|uniref:AAA+ ATPase domain-containing protein n=1 Tax=Kingdonia uniflora TaxID=39325 RepID=A0A7J7N4K0_9MAGN|nr:hypothetical protein GIB67_008260 [Kingdonia uniflora]